MFDSNFHDRLVLTTVAPVVAVGGIFLTWVVLRRRILLKGGGDVRASVASLTSKSIRLSVMVLFTVFPMVSTTIFRTFQYDYRLNDGTAYLNADYSIEKHEGTHQIYVAYASVMCLLYCFGIPAASWFALRSKKAQIQDFVVLSESLAVIEQGEALECQGSGDDDGGDQVQNAMHPHWKKTLLQKQVVVKAINQFVGGSARGSENGFAHLDFATAKQSLLAMKELMNEQDPWLSGLSPLYKDYESEYWWFEVAKFISTLILCGPVTLVPIEGASQVFVSMVVSMFMMSLFANCRPYVDFSNDVLAQFCQVSLTFAMAVALLEKALESSRDALFGPLLIICTSLNLGLGVGVVVLEFAITLAAEMPSGVRLTLPLSVTKLIKLSTIERSKSHKASLVVVPSSSTHINVHDDSSNSGQATTQVLMSAAERRGKPAPPPLKSKAKKMPGVEWTLDSLGQEGFVSSRLATPPPHGIESQ